MAGGLCGCILWGNYLNLLYKQPILLLAVCNPGLRFGFDTAKFEKTNRLECVL